MKLSLPSPVTDGMLPVTCLSLLDPVAPPRADGVALQETLVFAFATGDAGSALERAVEDTPLGESAWQPDDFARDVFLPDLVARALSSGTLGATRRPGGLLQRILSNPPQDPSVTRFRQEVFTELLGRPELRIAVDRLAERLATLRAILAKPTGLRIDALERRLSVLRAIRDVVALAAGSFAGTSSGLARIDAWGRATEQSPAYQRLLYLLAYEECTAELDVRLRLGVDGKIRDFEVLGRREPLQNPFHRTACQTFLTKVTLFFQGYRFSDHELLARLVDGVFEDVVPLLPPLFTLAAGLELYVAGLAFHEAAERAGLPVSLPSFAADEATEGDQNASGHALHGLWNPLLLAEGARIVPCDLVIARADTRVIVTGPNSGGKTRLLQALALTQVLAQSGLFVPARSARVPWVSGLFVSLLEDSRADQSEGRLGTELLRIRRLFESLRPGSLVILDELCSGTNPDEGEEIFRLVVKLLGELRPAAFITTHFLRFAARLVTERSGEAGDLQFLQVELDGAEQPTFQFVPGVATTSLAHRTAVRLGVTEEALRAAMARRREL